MKITGLVNDSFTFPWSFTMKHLESGHIQRTLTSYELNGYRSDHAVGGDTRATETDVVAALAGATVVPVSTWRSCADWIRSKSGARPRRSVFSTSALTTSFA